LKCIVFCSGKGGTGKSCAAAYTGVALAAAGKKTLLLELGGDAPSLELILGVKDCAHGIWDIFSGRCEVSDAIVKSENYPGLFLLPSKGGTPEQNEAKLQALMKSLEHFDFVVVDGGGGADFPVRLCSVFVIVTTPDTLSVRACAQAAQRLREANAKEVRLLINNVPPRIIPINGAEDFDDVIDIVGARLIGIIPSSPKLAFCSNNEQPLDPESLTVKIFENLAARLMGQRRLLLIR